MNGNKVSALIILWILSQSAFAAKQHSEAENTLTVIVLVLLVVGIIVFAIYTSLQQKQLSNPENTNVVYLTEVETVATLNKEGNFLLRIYRQSGNLQKDDQIFSNSSAAIASAISTFKRAGIEYVVISKNTENHLAFGRPFHNHRGGNEGKKVGRVEIYRNS